MRMRMDDGCGHTKPVLPRNGTKDEEGFDFGDPTC
jgi:hypothetical protein